VLGPVVDDLLAGRRVEWVRRRDARRRLAWAALPGASDGPRTAGRVFLKHFLRADRHRLREWWKRRLHVSTPEREWRALVALRARGVPVPAPLAHVATPGGERVLVTEFVEGTPLPDALAVPRRERDRVIAAVGRAVRALHAAGRVHRDLHAENLLVTPYGVIVTDLQSVRRGATRRARLRDLGDLDHSLRRRLSVADRVRLRAAALGLAPPFDAAARDALRAVGRASQRRARAYARSRAGRSLRAGRRFRALRHAGGRGLVRREADDAAVRAALEAVDGTPALAVRRFPAALSDLWRGSTARRAWYAAHALEARDAAPVRPVAFLEWGRAGLPGRSALVSEAARAPQPADPQALARAVAALWTRLHEEGFDLPGVGAEGVAWTPAADGPRACVAALERVRGPGRPGDAARLASLARLDASLEAAGVPRAVRCRAFARYAARLPFALSRDAAARRIAAIRTRSRR